MQYGTIPLVQFSIVSNVQVAMSRILIIRPYTDQVEKWLSTWGDKVLKTIASSPSDFAHVEVDDLLGPGLTRDSVDKLLDKANTVIYYGHGSTDSLGWPALIDTAAADALIGDGIIAFACDAGEYLGPETVAAGLSCFVGFSDSFVVVDDTKHAPWSLWMEIIVSATLMTRGTAQDVYDALVARLGQVYKDFKEGAYSRTQNAPLIWMTADWNLRHLVLLGDRTFVLA